MQSSRVVDGIRIGAVSAAATAGVIVGLGLRHQAAMSAFLMSGRATLATVTGLVAPAPVAALVGLLAHVCWMVLWGICFSMVATPLRGMQRLLAAILVTGLAGLLSTSVAPGALGAGGVATQNSAQLLVLLAVFALSLLGGIRLAPKPASHVRP